MMENRSFDHMLGYLRLSGRRPELDGLRPEMANVYHDQSGKFPQLRRAQLRCARAARYADDQGAGSAARRLVGRQAARRRQRWLRPDLHGRARRPDGGTPGRRDGLPHGQALAGLRSSVREVLRLRPLVQLGCGLDVPQPALLVGRPCGREAGERESAHLPPALVLPPSRRRQGRLVGDLRARRDPARVGGRQRLSRSATCSTSTSPGSTATSGRRTLARRSSSGRRQGSCRASPGSTRASPTCGPG